MLTLNVIGVLPDGTAPVAGVPANTALALAAPAGADFAVALQVVTPANQPVPLAGSTLLLTLKKRATDAQVVVARLGTVTGMGTASFRFVPADTYNLEPGMYAYDVWLTDTDGVRSRLVDPAVFQVQQAVGLPSTVGNVPFFPPATTATRMFLVAAPAFADPAAVHAAHPANGANTWPGPITNPDKPRNATVTFPVGWDGGNVTVNGFDQFGAQVSEVFTSAPGSTVVGSKIFASVSSITKAATGATANAASVGTGDKLGIAGHLADTAAALLIVDNAAEPATLDATYNGFTPSVTLPNGVASYVLIAAVTE